MDAHELVIKRLIVLIKSRVIILVKLMQNHSVHFSVKWLF